MGSPINDCSFSHVVDVLLGCIRKNFNIYEEDRYNGLQ